MDHQYLPKACCFIFSPRLGTKIIGYVGVFLATFGDVSSIIALVSDAYADHCIATENPVFCKNLATGSIAATIAVCIIYIGLSVALIYAVKEERPGFLRPFLILFPMYLGFAIISYVGGLFLLKQQWLYAYFACTMIFGIIVIVVMFHSYMVVLVYKNEISEVRPEPAQPDLL